MYLEGNEEFTFSLSKNYGSGELFVFFIPTLTTIGIVMWVVKNLGTGDWKKLIDVVVVVAVVVAFIILLFIWINLSHF